jgi:N-acetylglucosamine-6-phosphate deacetylase
MAMVLAGARIFDGEAFIDHGVVVIEAGKIVDVTRTTSLFGNDNVVVLEGGLLAPGFIDVQVNGGGGALLNQHPSVDTVRTIADSHRRFGTTGMLATVITDTPETIAAAVEAVRRARMEGALSILGIHIEGPFLDPARKGAHQHRFMREIEDSDIVFLRQAGCGEVMLTVAPNIVPPDMIGKLAQAGVRVSLGHSDAGLDQVQAALQAGATSFTHLFNAMSQISAREPGMVGAALADKTSYLGIIADGQHTHDAVLRLAFAATSPDRFMLVSDAMPPAADGPDSFELQGRTVHRVAGRLQLEDGTLAGSNLTMDEAVRYCVRTLGVPLAQALQMASRNPARFLGRPDLGVVRVGATASLVHLGEDLHVRQTWVEGQ